MADKKSALKKLAGVGPKKMNVAQRAKATTARIDQEDRIRKAGASFSRVANEASSTAKGIKETFGTKHAEHHARAFEAHQAAAKAHREAAMTPGMNVHKAAEHEKFADAHSAKAKQHNTELQKGFSRSDAARSAGGSGEWDESKHARDESGKFS